MALITRLTRLFQADFHAVLDRVEDPAVLLRQAVREMEESLTLAETEVRGIEAECESLRRRRQDLGTALAEIDQELDLCFTSDKEELARELLRRKLTFLRLARRVEARLGELDVALEYLRRELRDHRTTLESTRQKADALGWGEPRGGVASATFPGHLPGALDEPVSDGDVELALLREKQRRAAR